MGKENRFTPPEVITKENLPAVLTEIGGIREIPGTSEMLIPQIRAVRKRVEELGELSIAVQLYQEEFLSAHHMVMEEKTQENKMNYLRLARGVLIMGRAISKMEMYLEKHGENLTPFIKAQIFRYLGRYADLIQRQPQRAEEHYRQWLEYFEATAPPAEKHIRLEALGFVAHSLLEQGKIEEGIQLVQQTLKDFNETEEGKQLKERDYYTWSVWKSGIENRTAEFLLKTKKPEYAELAKKLIAAAKVTLTMPENAQQQPLHRLDELKGTERLID